MDATAYRMCFDEDQLATLCAQYDRRLDSLGAENAKLRESCSELLRMAESNDPDFLHWPEIHDELRKLGVEVDG